MWRLGAHLAQKCPPSESAPPPLHVLGGRYKSSHRVAFRCRSHTPSLACELQQRTYVGCTNNPPSHVNLGRPLLPFSRLNTSAPKLVLFNIVFLFAVLLVHTAVLFPKKKLSPNIKNPSRKSMFLFLLSPLSPLVIIARLRTTTVPRFFTCRVPLRPPCTSPSPLYCHSVVCLCLSEKAQVQRPAPVLPVHRGEPASHCMKRPCAA